MSAGVVALGVIAVAFGVVAVILGWGLGALLCGGVGAVAHDRHAQGRPAREARKRAARRRGPLL
jgi:hypothetical protein